MEYTCPNCGSYTLEVVRADDNEGYYKVFCCNCGYSGEGWYKLVYLGIHTEAGEILSNMVDNSDDWTIDATIGAFERDARYLTGHSNFDNLIVLFEGSLVYELPQGSVLVKEMSTKKGKVCIISDF